MSNFDLIDDYLTNKLNEQEKKSFENHLISDPALKADVELQKDIIEGLKAARVAELKAMLINVPVTSPTFYFSPLRIAAGFIGTAVLATGLYFYFDEDTKLDPHQVSSSMADSISQTEQIKSELQEDSAIHKIDDSATPIIDPKEGVTEKKSTDNQVKKSTKEIKPKIDLLDPTDELAANDVSLEKSGATNTSISVAKVDVTINSAERKYKSHYQFASGKLILYGTFDHELYEIIEVNAQSSRSLFLVYKSSYYLLDETKKEVTLLKEITDPVLIQKLKAFQAN